MQTNLTTTKLKIYRFQIPHSILWLIKTQNASLVKLTSLYYFWRPAFPTNKNNVIRRRGRSPWDYQDELARSSWLLSKWRRSIDTNDIIHTWSFPSFGPHSSEEFLSMGCHLCCRSCFHKISCYFSPFTPSIHFQSLQKQPAFNNQLDVIISLYIINVSINFIDVALLNIHNPWRGKQISLILHHLVWTFGNSRTIKQLA